MEAIFSRAQVGMALCVFGIHWPDEYTSSVLFHPVGQSFFTCGESGLKQWPVALREDLAGARLELGPARNWEHRGSLGVGGLSADGSTLGFFHQDQAHILNATSW